MSDVFRANRKATDKDIIRLNSVGLSLGAIGERLGCHPSTITIRLNSLNVAPADTRRSFMDRIYNNLSPDQQAWLESQLGPHISIQDYLQNLMVKEYLSKSGASQSHA